MYCVGEDGDEKLAFKLLCAMLLKKGCLPFVYEECKVNNIAQPFHTVSRVRSCM